MNIEELKEELGFKLTAEYNGFLTDLQQMDTLRIIDKAYEKVIKEELTYSIENSEYDFDEDELQALLDTENLLDLLYDRWLGSYDNFAEDTAECLEEETYAIMRDRKVGR